MPAGLQLRREVEAAGSALDASRAGEAELRRELAGERSRRDQQAEEVAGLQSELREARAEAVQGAAAAARMRVLQTDGEDAAAEVAAGLQAELGAALLELREAGAARKGESRAAVRLGAAAFQRGSWMLTTHDRGAVCAGTDARMRELEAAYSVCQSALAACRAALAARQAELEEMRLAAIVPEPEPEPVSPRKSSKTQCLSLTFCYLSTAVP